MSWVKDEILAWQIVEGNDGPRYWVLADSQAEALSLWLEHEWVWESLDQNMDKAWFTISLAENLADLDFWGDDGEQSSMLEEMERDPSARVVACTEWVP